MIGRLYCVAASGTSGVFAGHEASHAGYGDGGWRFIAPVEGLRLTEQASGVEVAYRGGAWTTGSVRANEVVVGANKVVGARGAAIPDATGGTVIDSQSRAALGLILAALRTHGLIQP